MLDWSLLLGFQVSCQVGSAEAIDRLLRIADHDECPIDFRIGNRCRFAKHSTEDAILNRVRVLKLVNQRDAILFPQTFQKQLFLAAIECFINFVKQIPKAHDATFAATLRNVLSHKPPGTSQQARFDLLLNS